MWTLCRGSLLPRREHSTRFALGSERWASAPAINLGTWAQLRLALVVGVLLLLALPGADLHAQTNSTGYVDPSFNTASLGLAGTGVQAMALQSDGKLVIAGGKHGIARLNADGSTDPTFNASTVGDYNGTSVS